MDLFYDIIKKSRVCDQGNCLIVRPFAHSAGTLCYVIPKSLKKTQSVGCKTLTHAPQIVDM